MIKEVTITKVIKRETNKATGLAYEYKNGKFAGQKYTWVGIKTEQTGDDMYSHNAMSGDRALTLQEGDTLVLKLTENNGFKNFAFMSKKEMEVYESMK